MRRTKDRSEWGDKAKGLGTTKRRHQSSHVREDQQLREAVDKELEGSKKPWIGEKCHWLTPMMTWGEVGNGTKEPFPLVRCQTMNDRLEETNSHKKGLMMSIMMHRDTGQERVLGIVHHRDTRGRGMLINYCPWCGGEIGPRPRAEDIMMSRINGVWRGKKFNLVIKHSRCLPDDLIKDKLYQGAASFLGVTVKEVVNHVLPTVETCYCMSPESMK